MEIGETPVETARRELREETGLVGGAVMSGPSFFTYTTETPYAHFPIVFKDIKGKVEVVEGERFSEWDYFSLTDLPSPMFHPSKKALDVAHPNSLQAAFGIAQASFLKIDMVALGARKRKNAAWTAYFFVERNGSVCASDQVTLVVTWGSRKYVNRNVRHEGFGSVADGLTRLEELIKKRVRNGYSVTDLSGDITLDRALALFPETGSVRVISDEFLWKLATDLRVRQAFKNDARRFIPNLEEYELDRSEWDKEEPLAGQTVLPFDVG